MIVVDASALVGAITARGAGGAHARERLVRRRCHVPHLIDLEVPAALRRLERSAEIDAEHAEAALGRFRRLRLVRYAHSQLLTRVWELRHNLTPYDAVYVALAEHLGVELVTADERLAGASGPRCPIEVVR